MALTTKEVNFSYFAHKTDFTSSLQTTLINNIVFIGDTKEVFTHGIFYGVQDLSQAYDSSTHKLQLKQGNTVISELDATPFIKDGMLNDVEYVAVQEQGVTVVAPYLKFTFNTDSGKSIIRVSMSDLATVYTGANVLLSSNYAMASSYSAPAVNDSVDTAVGKLAKGISDLDLKLKWNEY